MDSGIYIIKNLKTGKVYVGGTRDLEKRESAHFRNLKCGLHENSTLQADYDKTSKDNFCWEVLFFCGVNDLSFFEEKVFNSYSRENLYNIRKVFMHRTHTEETKAILSEKISSRYKNGHCHPMLGRHHSQETKNLISKKNKRKCAGKKNAMYGKGLFGSANGMYGRSHSQEAKLKMSIARKEYHENRKCVEQILSA